MSERPKENPALEMVSERTKEVQKNCKDTAYKVHSFNDPDFAEACKVLAESCSLKEGLMPPELLKKRLNWLRSEAGSAHEMFNPALEYYLTIYPTTPWGNLLEPKDVDRHAYMHLFVVNGKNGYTSNFSGEEAKFSELLPDYIKQNCRLAVPKEWNHDFRIKAEQLRILNDSYGDAYNRLREFLNLPPIDINKLMQKRAA